MATKRATIPSPGRKTERVSVDTHVTPLPRSALFHYWHPQRHGVEFPPYAFQDDLATIHPNLRVVKSPVHCRWIVWHQDPTVTHPLCPGWKLIFVWMVPGSGRYLPCDARLLANIVVRDPRRYANGVAYFEPIMREEIRKREKAQSDDWEERHAIRRDFNQYRRIKNIGHGSKYALHHDGTVEASKGEQNWLADRGGVRGHRR